MTVLSQTQPYTWIVRQALARPFARLAMLVVGPAVGDQHDRDGWRDLLGARAEQAQQAVLAA